MLPSTWPTRDVIAHRSPPPPPRARSPWARARWQDRQPAILPCAWSELPTEAHVLRQHRSSGRHPEAAVESLTPWLGVLTKHYPTMDYEPAVRYATPHLYKYRSPPTRIIYGSACFTRPPTASAAAGQPTKGTLQATMPPRSGLRARTTAPLRLGHHRASSAGSRRIRDAPTKSQPATSPRDHTSHSRGHDSATCIPLKGRNT